MIFYTVVMRTSLLASALVLAEWSNCIPLF